MNFIGDAEFFILIMIFINKKLSKLVKGMAKPVKLSAEISVLVPCVCNSHFTSLIQMSKIISLRKLHIIISILK